MTTRAPTIIIAACESTAVRAAKGHKFTNSFNPLQCCLHRLSSILPITLLGTALLTSNLLRRNILLQITMSIKQVARCRYPNRSVRRYTRLISSKCSRAVETHRSILTIDFFQMRYDYPPFLRNWCNLSNINIQHHFRQHHLRNLCKQSKHIIPFPYRYMPNLFRPSFNIILARFSG